MNRAKNLIFLRHFRKLGMNRLMVGLLLLLTACAPKIHAPSILSDQVCGRSCWNGITVGTTTRQDLLDTLPHIAGIDQESIAALKESGILFDERIDFALHKDSTGDSHLVTGTAWVKDDIVIVMTVGGELGVQFQDVVHGFGAPKWVSTVKDPRGYIAIRHISPSEGIEFRSTAKSQYSRISGDDDIGFIMLFDPDLCQLLLESNWIVPDHEYFILYPWDGYGRIKDHCWPPG